MDEQIKTLNRRATLFVTPPLRVVLEKDLPKYHERKHTNMIVRTFWELGYLAEYIKEYLNKNGEYRFFYVIDLKQLLLVASNDGKLKAEDIDAAGRHWKNALKEMKAVIK